MVDQLADALDADEGGVTFVAVEHVVLDAQLAQRADTADAEQDLLLETVLPVAAVEVVGDLAILLEVAFIVRVEQVEVRAPPPDTSRPVPKASGPGRRWRR